MNELSYLLGSLDYYRTKKTVITDPFYYALAKKVGGVRIEGGFELKSLLSSPPKIVNYSYPENFKEKMAFFISDGRATFQNVDKAESYFASILKKINTGKLRGTEIADFIYAVWGIINLSYQMSFGNVALVKEKPIGNTVLKKASVPKIINAIIRYIMEGNEPNIWKFNFNFAGYIEKNRQDW